MPDFRRPRRTTPLDRSWRDDHPLCRMKRMFQSDDLVVTYLDVRPEVGVVYFEPLVDADRLVDEVFEPVEREVFRDRNGGEPDPRRRLGQAVRTSKLEDAAPLLLRGYVALFVANRDDVSLVSVERNLGRPVSTATTEVQLLGPKEAFTEDLQTNLNRLRNRLPTDTLRVKTMQVGRVSHTEVAVVYIDGVADSANVEAVLDGVRRIDVDVVRGSNDINEVLFQASMTPFPLSQRTERPDRVAESLADGRVAIFVDGTPFPLIVPTTLNELQRDGEAFLGGTAATVFVRWLRYGGVFISLTAAALYAALLSVDPQLLSPRLLQAVALTRQGVPYPVLFEALVMMIVLDIVTEATLQAPSPIGSTLTIAGSLIIGQAAVQAQLVSQLMVIVLAITALGALLAINIPLGYAVRICKYPVILAGGIFGLYGVLLSLLALSVHLAALKSLGVPYMTPFGPARWSQLRYYSLLSSVKGGRILRPESYGPEDEVRIAPQGKDPVS